VYGFRFHGSIPGREIADKARYRNGGSVHVSLKILASDADYCMILLVLGE